MNRSSFSFPSLPPAIKSLLIANAAIFVLQQFLPGWFEFYLGLVPLKTVGSLYLWQPVTYLFLHGSFFHLLLNLFSLWMFGRELEALWGTGEFLKFYFFCGVGAAGLNVLFEPYSMTPVIGASGAIYGILVAFAMLYPDAIIYFYGILPLKSRHFVIILAAVEFLAGFHCYTTTVARFAHLGGMLAGFLYLRAYEVKSTIRNWFRKAADHAMSRKITGRKRPMEFHELSGEVDRILEKVLVKGADSLTESEREIMRRYSSMKH